MYLTSETGVTLGVWSVVHFDIWNLFFLNMQTNFTDLLFVLCTSLGTQFLSKSGRRLKVKVWRGMSNLWGMVPLFSSTSMAIRVTGGNIYRNMKICVTFPQRDEITAAHHMHTLLVLQWDVVAAQIECWCTSNVLQSAFLVRVDHPKLKKKKFKSTEWHQACFHVLINYV